MSGIATTLQILIEAGVTGNALVTAIAKIDAAFKAEQVAQRSTNAIRQQRYRERLEERNSDVTTVTSDVKEKAVSSPSPFPPITPLTPTPTSQKERGARLKDFLLKELPTIEESKQIDFMPDAFSDLWTEKRGVNDERLFVEWEKFVKHFQGPDAKRPVKKDWLGTWLNWIMK